ncbi:ABC transporter permease [Corynebacterium sp. HMSC078H07]|uniref:ABC transporter permease n=1 Tax=Corynebacterium sp. HMSC078H07 TaxID=1739379 RepID=UPI0009F440C0|nr:ABC transporter permease subunit [Corynebacterium sp. HMSC078H07]
MAQQLATAASPTADTAQNIKASKPNGQNINWVVTTIFVIALVFFFGPWIAAAVFGFTRPGEGFTFEPLISAFDNPRAVSAVIDTLLLAVATTLLMLILLVPTIVFLNLKSPRLARVAEFLSVLPLVIPAVALVSGVSEFYRAVAPSFLVSKWSLVPLYVIVALPLCYRAIDAGVKALDLKTMFAASSSLGATSTQTLFNVVLPNLRVSMLSASLLSIAMTLGEFAIASLLLHYTFPVFIVEVSRSNPRGIAALSFITILITWALMASISAIAKIDSARKEK